jgi:phage anti-repressor protein
MGVGVGAGLDTGDVRSCSSGGICYGMENEEEQRMNELIPFSQLEKIAQSTDLYPVDFDDAWQWVGYSRKDHALEALKVNFEEGIDFDSRKGGNQTKGRGGGRKAETQDGNLISRNNDKNQNDFDSSILINQTFDSGLNRNQKITPSKQGRGGDRRSVAYFLTTDCFKAFCMMAGTQKGKEVRRYYLDIEKKYLSIVQDTRLSKLVRRDFTDVIQSSGLNITMHGFAFKQFTDLINKAVLGMDARKYRETNNLSKDANVREHVTPVQLASIAKIEKLVGAAIEVGADYYKVKDLITDMGIGKIESRGSGGAA